MSVSKGVDRFCGKNSCVPLTVEDLQKSNLNFLLGPKPSATLNMDSTLPSTFTLPDYSITRWIFTVAGCILLLLALLLYSALRIPSNFPKNIPAVPIYISLMGLWSDMGQDEIYDRWLRARLEKYGAVKIWFAGRWNILMTRPEFLSDMLKREDVFAKAGSQKKIPWSVMASLVGDNIINAHGEDWKLYTSVMKPGLQKTNFDTRPILVKSRRFVDLLVEEQGTVGRDRGVLVNPIIQRFAIAAMGESFLDIDFEVSDRLIKKQLKLNYSRPWIDPICALNSCKVSSSAPFSNPSFSTFLF